MINNLPNGWRVEKLGNLVKRMHQGINTAADKVEFSNSGYPILQTKNISKGIIDFNDTKYMNNEYWEKYKEKYKPKINDVLLANIGTIGKNVIVKEESDYLIHWNIFLIEPNQNLITTNYLKSFFDKLYNQNYYDLFLKGGTVKFISKSFLIDLEIPIPPLQQQEKIVKVLDLTSSLIEKQKELLKKYDLFLKSKFIEMFGDPISNPMGWEVEKLENLIERNKHSLKTGPFGSSLKKEFYVENGYKIYGQEQVIKNDFTYGNYYIDNDKYETLKNYSIKENDILISLVGTFGKIAIVPKKFEAGIINPRLMKISLNTVLYNPIFFKDLFYTEAFKAQLLNFSHGGTMGILNLSILKELKYIKPPIELQNKFASIVEKIETIKEKENQKLKQLENLHNSMMNKAFKGEII